ncbi:MAG: ABC-2 family transporter protein [Thermoleophilia bacterium]|nr:ABC-2 family transporter protein [Thermoleophilia bacterium]
MIPHAGRVLRSHLRIAISSELAYRSNFWLYLLNSVLTLAASLSGLALVYAHIDTLGGWTVNDLLVVIGVFFTLGAFVNGVVHMSIAQLVADIRQGAFDFRLLKPVDAQLVALGQKPDPWRILDVALGLGVIVVGLARGGFDGGLGAIVVATCMFAISVAIIGAFWSLLACVTFWTVQGEGILWALDDMYDHLRWPITVFPTALRIALSTVFPAGLAVTVPAQALTGRLDATTAATAAAVALILVVLARWVWNRAVQRYEGASA